MLTSVPASSPPSIKPKRHKHQKAFFISCPSSTPCYLSPIMIPSTPTTTNSSQRPLCEGSTMTSTDNSSTSTTTDAFSSAQNLANHSARISAISELIETEQRYVRDLRVIANDFIKPLSNLGMINDYDIEQLFSNWFNLIACNAVLLTTLQEQVNYQEHIVTADDEPTTPTPRSASMSNIALTAQAMSEPLMNTRHGSFSTQEPSSPVSRLFRYRTGRHTHRRRSPSPNRLTLNRPMRIGPSGDNIVPEQSSAYEPTMSITESTQIGEILCSYLPYMADAYFEYCNHRSQANRNLQSKVDSNKEFRASVQVFQTKTGGLSLNGYLTKPIQRVTRYPLLIEKILRHTPTDHPDHQPVQQAFECARQLNQRIDKQIHEQENRSRLDWLQQHMIFGTDEYSTDGYIFDELLKFNSPTKLHSQRQLLLHGAITKIPSGKELCGFLFNDFLLLSTIKSSSSHWQSQLFDPKSTLQLKLYRSPYFLTDLITTNEALSDRLSFSIATKTQSKSLLLKTELSSVRTLWVRSINTAMTECQAIEKSIRNERALFSITNNLDNEHQPRSVVARLDLFVNEACILPVSTTTPLPPHRSINPYCEITVGSSTMKTSFVKRNNRPKWNQMMQFLLYNFNEDIIHINLFDYEFFSPDENIGYISMHLTDILPSPLATFRNQSSHTFMQIIQLNNGSSVTIKFAVQFLSSDE